MLYSSDDAAARLGAISLQTSAHRGVNAGVQLRWLKKWAKKVPPGMSTLDVVWPPTATHPPPTPSASSAR